MINKFLKFILLISLFILFYTFYKSEITWDGLRRDYYSTYYFIGLILLSFYFVNLLLSENIRTYFNIFFISLVFSLYLFEGYLNLITSDKYLLKKKIKNIQIKNK